MKRLATFLLGLSVVTFPEKARQLHFSSLILDTHVDTPWIMVTRPGWSFAQEHREGHADLPRIKKGGLRALFMGVAAMDGSTAGPAAVNEALVQIAAVHKLAEDLPGEVGLCRTAAEVRKTYREGKIAVLIGVEGGKLINNSLPVLRMFSKLGVRYMTLTHGSHTDWADSSGQPARYQGLTTLGREIVLEMNRLGILVDISHVSDKTFWDVLEISQAPLIASHSSCRALSGHARNLSDDMIKAMAAKGGVIHINYYNIYLDNARYEYWKKTQPLMGELTKQWPGEENQGRRETEIAKQFGEAPKVSWERIVDHIDHVVKLVGADHVGLGSDFDGDAPMPDGMEDVTQLPKITAALLAKGYKETDIKKILGENTLRVMEAAERVSKVLPK
jgi:membrane dipeptidase